MTINCHHIWIRSVNKLTHQITKSIPIIKREKMIVNLGIKKRVDNNKSTCQLNYPHNLLLVSIFDNPEKDLSYVDRKIYRIKIRT